MAKSDATRNALVNADAALGNWYALHTGDPGITGANEVTTVGGVYARQQSTIPAAAGTGGSAGTTTGSAVTFGVPAGTTVTHWSRRTAATGGAHIDGGLLPNSPPGETYVGQGEYVYTPTISQAA